mmetsp:Transcript_38922/g.128874  ORF Transcript_38922/g.128874 Transcript_38922/m.128874 type:complete len:351 (+) Transcript_38922:355-1407(+)
MLRILLRGGGALAVRVWRGRVLLAVGGVLRRGRRLVAVAGRHRPIPGHTAVPSVLVVAVRGGRRVQRRGRSAVWHRRHAAPRRGAGRRAARVDIAAGHLLGAGLVLALVDSRLEADARALAEGVAVGDVHGVHEDVVAAAIRDDEPEPLLHVEPLGRPHHLSRRRRRLAQRRPARGASHARRDGTHAAGRRAHRIDVRARHLLRRRLVFDRVVRLAEAHTRTLAQRIAVGQRVAVGKDVLAPVVGDDEAEPALHVEALGRPHHLARRRRRLSRRRAASSWLHGRCERRGDAAAGQLAERAGAHRARREHRLGVLDRARDGGVHRPRRGRRHVEAGGRGGAVGREQFSQGL